MDSKNRLCESVSIVDPLFEPKTIMVCVKSPCPCRRTWPGSVESKITISRPSFAQMTSGASEDPPIPQSRTRVKFFDLAQAERASISGSNDLEVVGRFTQPSRILASDSLSSPQRLESKFASLCAESAIRSTRARSGAFLLNLIIDAV